MDPRSSAVPDLEGPPVLSGPSRDTGPVFPMILGSTVNRAYPLAEPMVH
jgi:hypothetical protein